MAKFNPVRFFSEVKKEVKRVTWPTWPETRVSTIMVFVMVTISSVFLFLADQVINAVIKLILGV
jgi:preprotein translocase subunit SecE